MGLRESVEAECAYHRKDPATCRTGSHEQVWVYSADLHICFPCLTDPKHFEENRRVILAKVKLLQSRLNSGTVEGKP
jgi:hypothetical protein